MDLDDLDGWTAYEDFLLELEAETSVKFICDSYLYGERTIEKATPEEVAYLTMRASSDPEFLNRHCKKISLPKRMYRLTRSYLIYENDKK